MRAWEGDWKEVGDTTTACLSFVLIKKGVRENG